MENIIEINREDYILLQAKVLQFYSKLKEEKDPYIYTVDFIEKYKNHFNITTQRQGKIIQNGDKLPEIKNVK